MSEPERLEALIKRHQDLYYNGESEITDAEFDALWEELKRVKPDSKVLQSIGRDIKEGFDKVRHIIPMGSQDKASNESEFLKWASKQKESAFVVEYKLDGASIELQYVDGKFVRAVTRGDGVIGDDITRNVKKMKGVVECVRCKDSERSVLFSGAVRGEVLMSRDVHRSMYSDKANCRNAANGIMKRKDGKGCEFLEVVCYDVGSLEDSQAYQIVSNNLSCKDELEKIQWLRSVGFQVVETKVFSEIDEIIEYRKHVAEVRALLPFDIDGLVVKNIEIDLEDWKRVRPEKQIAFKFETEKAVSEVEDVEWSETGATYTPIAIIREVRLAGTTVRRASLANINIITNLGIMIGSRVLVAKRGEIIPKIEEVLENPPGSVPIKIPSVCNVCGTSLMCDGIRLYCPNKNCQKVALHRIKKWIDVLEIRELGPTLLHHLFSLGYVNKIRDLYLLTTDLLASVDRMGVLSSQKVYDSIHSNTIISLSQFIAGFDIENIGLTMADKIVSSGIDTVEKLFAITQEELESIEGFAQRMSHAFVSQLSECKPEMQELLSTGCISIKNDIKHLSGKLLGMSFCFTGELKRMKRKEASQLVINAGGIVKTSVTKGLTYLVTNDSSSTSTKTRKAIELNIAIIDEDTFFAML